MVDIKKTNVKVVPVTAEIDGQRVVVGEAEVVAEPSTDRTDAILTVVVRLDLETPEGLSMDAMMNRGLLNAISVSSTKAELINKVAERNKQYKKDNPDDGTDAGTAGTE